MIIDKIDNQNKYKSFIKAGKFFIDIDEIKYFYFYRYSYDYADIDKIELHIVISLKDCKPDTIDSIIEIEEAKNFLNHLSSNNILSVNNEGLNNFIESL